jgi:hypothetical protein
MSAAQHAEAFEREHCAKQRADLVARIIKRVAELPNRSSPDDWPEAMLVTGDELASILNDEFDAD